MHKEVTQVSVLVRNNRHGLDIFDDIFSSWEDIFGGRQISVSPDRHKPMVKEFDDKYEISLAAPGVSKKDFNITVEGEKLTVAYQAKESESYYAFASNYSKNYTLPRHSDVENISATYKNGVLIVAIPKTPESTARQITIK